VGRMTIRLLVNPTTGKREVDIAYESDSDALPMEHEEEHRRLVEKVVGKLGNKKLTVERESEAPVEEQEQQQQQQQQQVEREKLKQ
jgi:hypothetical protein